MQNIINILVNFFLVTMPEQIFITAMSIILTKKTYGLLDTRMWKQNIWWILIPAIPISIIDNLNSILFSSNQIIKLSNFLLFYILISFVIKQNSDNFEIKDHKRIVSGFLLSFLMICVIESVTFQTMLILLNKSLVFVNANGFWNFIASAPSRIIEIIILIFLVVKNNNIVKFKMFDIITTDNFMLISIALFIIGSNIFAMYLIKLIGVDMILKNLSIIGQIIISMSIIVFPALILLWVLLILNKYSVREILIQQTYENLAMQDDVILDVEDQFEGGDINEKI